ncbi:iron chaperone [Rummeliibacillus sp. JY-2-4R]
MENNKVVCKTIDEYIANFGADVQAKLQMLREVIKEAAPEATETISYQMPAFKYEGNLVYFAAYKKHIGFYPTSSGIREFQNELTQYKGGKGTVQFPIEEPLPLDLVSKIVKFRVEENRQKAKKKK